MSFLLFLLASCAPSTDEADQETGGSWDVTEPGLTARSWYPDADDDGYGDINAAPIVATGVDDDTVAYVTNALDCDDADPSRSPGAVEVCNNADDDCDNLVDDAAIDQPQWFLDHDGDGYGDGNTAVQNCDGLSHFINDGTDCDDMSAAVFPSAPESCNSIDDDCDGSVDEDPTFGTTYYMDADGDGSGSAAEDAETIVACERPGFEWIPGNTDCDDTDPEIERGADEICDEIDNDCDGDIDENAVDAMAWSTDFDGDGYGDMYSSMRSCTQSPGMVADSSDCDDWMFETNPDAEEVCDWMDNDCDGFLDDDDPDGVTGTTEWYPDMDFDGYGSSSVAPTEACEYGAMMSSGGWNVTVDGTDCDDADVLKPGNDPDGDEFDLCEGECDDRNWRANPDAIETSNGYDDDCDGSVDEVE